MTIRSALSRRILPALLAMALAVPAQAAVRLAVPDVPRAAVAASASCTAIGQSLAASQGGRLLTAVAQQRGGGTVCVITYTVPSRDGRPPRRVETTVNAG